MTHVSDSKRDAMFAIVGGTNKNIDDLEKLYLEAKSATADTDVNGQWMEVFLANGATSPDWNDAAAEFLIVLGYSGDISGMWKAFWDAGGVIPP